MSRSCSDRSSHAIYKQNSGYVMQSISYYILYILRNFTPGLIGSEWEWGSPPQLKGKI